MATMGRIAYIIEAKTQPLKSGLRDAKMSMASADKQMGKSAKAISSESKKMSKVSGDALQPMEQGLSAINPAAGRAAAGMKSAAMGAKVLNAALGPIGIAIGLLATAIAALTSYFRGSVEGQQRMAKIMAYLGGVVDFLKDAFIDLGKWIITAVTDPQKALSQLTGRFQGFIDMVTSGWRVILQGARGVSLAIKGIFDKDAREASKQAFAEMRQGMDDFRDSARQAWEGVKDIGKAINERAKETMALQDRENKLQMQQIENQTKLARINAEIAKARMIANDEQAEAAEAIAAQERAMELVNQKFALQEKMAREALAIQRERMALGHDTIEDLEKEAQLAADLINLEQARDSEMRNLLRRHGTLVNRKEAEHEAEMKAIADKEAAQQAAFEKEMESRAKILEEIRRAGLTEVEILEEAMQEKLEMHDWSEAERAKITQHYQDKIDEILEASKEKQVEDVEEISQVWQNMSEVVGGAMAGMANELGSVISGAESDFKSLASSMLNSIQQVINGLLAKAIAGIIAGEAQKGLLGIATAAVGIGLVKGLFDKHVPKMAGGGVIPPGYPNDTYPALLTSGETVLPPGKLPGGGGKLTTSIKRDELIFWLEDGQSEIARNF